MHSTGQVPPLEVIGQHLTIACLTQACPAPSWLQASGFSIRVVGRPLIIAWLTQARLTPPWAQDFKVKGGRVQPLLGFRVWGSANKCEGYELGPCRGAHGWLILGPGAAEPLRPDQLRLPCVCICRLCRQRVLTLYSRSIRMHLGVTSQPTVVGSTRSTASSSEQQIWNEMAWAGPDPHTLGSDSRRLQTAPGSSQAFELLSLAGP